MSPTLDVLVMISDTTPRSFVNECQRSIKAAIELCPYPVKVIETPGVPGHIGQARLKSLAQSSAEYVAWVDDDDFVLPQAFAVLADALATRPPAIYARELSLLANGHLVPHTHRHHLSLYARDAIDQVPFEQLPAFDKAALLQVGGEAAVDVLQWVYVYRQWLSAGLKLRAHLRRTS